MENTNVNSKVNFNQGEHRIIENKNRIIIFGKVNQTDKILNIAGKKLHNYEESKIKFVRNFKANWFLNVAVKIKDNEYVKVNIGSLKKHLGISRSEIRQLIKADKTFKEILQKITPEKLEDTPSLDINSGETKEEFALEEENEPDIIEGSDAEVQQPENGMKEDVDEIDHIEQPIETTEKENVDVLHGMTKEEFGKIEEYCEKNHEKYSGGNKLIRISKEKSGLPRTLHYVPKRIEGQEEGWYINLGTKGSLEFAVEGSTNRATHILRLKDKKLFVKRSGKMNKGQEEMECNKALKGTSEHIAAGTPFEYKGTIIDREIIHYIKRCIPKGEVRRMAFQIIKGKEKKEKKERAEWIDENIKNNEEIKNSIKKNGFNSQECPAIMEKLCECIDPKYRKTNVAKIEYIMDNIPGGDLFGQLYDSEGKLESLGKRKILTFARGITEGLKVMHRKGWIHCDLKPENILLDGDTAKITDFDLAVKKGNRITLRGTPGYLAPELFSESEKNEKIDIWSHGCILAELAYGDKWTKAANEFEESQYRNSQDVTRKKEELFPNYNDKKHLDYVIFRCLSLDPAQRPTAEGMSKMLNGVENVG